MVGKNYVDIENIIEQPMQDFGHYTKLKEHVDKLHLLNTVDKEQVKAEQHNWSSDHIMSSTFVF